MAFGLVAVPTAANTPASSQRSRTSAIRHAAAATIMRPSAYMREKTNDPGAKLMSAAMRWATSSSVTSAVSRQIRQTAAAPHPSDTSSPAPTTSTGSTRWAARTSSG